MLQEAKPVEITRSATAELKACPSPRALLQIRLSTFENLALVLPMLVTCLLRASGTVWNNLPLY